MKKLTYIFSLIFFFSVNILGAQIISETGSRIEIADSAGRKLAYIASDDGFFVGVNSMEVFFELSRKKNSDNIIYESSPFSVNKKNSGKNRRKNKYRSKLGVLEFGFNNFTSPDYSAYTAADGEFLDLHMAKSNYVTWNLLRISEPLNKSRSTDYGARVKMEQLYVRQQSDHAQDRRHAAAGIPR